MSICLHQGVTFLWSHAERSEDSETGCNVSKSRALHSTRNFSSPLAARYRGISERLTEATN